MNLGYEVGIHMRDAILKYKLKMKTTSSSSVQLENEHCLIWLNSDYTGVDINFKNPNNEASLTFGLWSYTSIVYGFYSIETQTDLKAKEWYKNQNTMESNYVRFFNKILLEYFAPVMAGDYSWSEKHDAWLTEIREIVAFLNYKPEWKQIRKKDNDKDITWIDDARALYILKKEEARNKVDDTELKPYVVSEEEKKATEEMRQKTDRTLGRNKFSLSAFLRRFWP